MSLTTLDWERYERDGLLRLGKVLSAEDLKRLQERIDDIMMGVADTGYDRLLMQLDSKDGAYENAGEASRGYKGATLLYRKIQDLEHDSLYMEYMQRPLFREICAHVYGGDTPISLFRAMFMNKPAHAGTLLPWHQDRWTDLDRDPLVTVWMALDPATVANGCVQVIPGSHHYGLVNPSHGSGFLDPSQVPEYAPDEKAEYLELEPGEAVLLHNWLLHRSDKNASDVSRRAFSVCYMDGRTKSASGGVFTPVFEGQESLVG